MYSLSDDDNNQLSGKEYHLQQTILGLFEKCKLPQEKLSRWKEHYSLKWWEGIELDDEGAVVEIFLYDKWIEGPLSASVWAQLAQRLPKLKRINLGLNKLSMEGGVLDLTNLPPGLERLRLGANQFTGTVDLTNLPPGLEKLYLGSNKFTGTVNLTKLPPGLEKLDLSDNQFTGTVDLTKLPKSLRVLWLSHNNLQGTYDLSRYPGCSIDLDGNPKVQLIGSSGAGLSLKCPPPCLCCFLPAITIFFLLALAVVIAANSESLSSSVCQQHLNGTCASFFDSCSTSTQVTALPPQDMLCPLSTKCCVAGNDNFFLARAAAGDTNNTFFYSSSSNDDGGNATTTAATMMQQSSFNYFLSPPVDYIGSEAVKEGGVDVNKALAQLCGKIGFSIVPPGAIWILLGGVLSAISYSGFLITEEKK